MSSTFRRLRSTRGPAGSVASSETGVGYSVLDAEAMLTNSVVPAAMGASTVTSKTSVRIAPGSRVSPLTMVGGPLAVMGVPSMSAVAEPPTYVVPDGSTSVTCTPVWAASSLLATSTV